MLIYHRALDSRLRGACPQQEASITKVRVSFYWGLGAEMGETAVAATSENRMPIRVESVFIRWKVLPLPARLPPFRSSAIICNPQPGRPVATEWLILATGRRAGFAWR